MFFKGFQPHQWRGSEIGIAKVDVVQQLQKIPDGAFKRLDRLMRGGQLLVERKIDLIRAAVG